MYIRVFYASVHILSHPGHVQLKENESGQLELVNVFFFFKLSSDLYIFQQGFSSTNKSLLTSPAPAGPDLFLFPVYILQQQCVMTVQ